MSWDSPSSVATDSVAVETETTSGSERAWAVKATVFPLATDRLAPPSVTDWRPPPPGITTTVVARSVEGISERLSCV